MNAREKLDEFAEMRGWNKNKLIGWSEAADFGDWYAEQVKNCNTPDVSVNEVSVCSRCGVKTVWHPTTLCNKCWNEVG